MRSELRESTGSDGDEDCIRLNNCLQRDFTINGYLVYTSVILKSILRLFVCVHCFFPYLRLMFDPYAKVVYDYLGGIEDIRKAKV